MELLFSSQIDFFNKLQRIIIFAKISLHNLTRIETSGQNLVYVKMAFQGIWIKNKEFDISYGPMATLNSSFIVTALWKAETPRSNGIFESPPDMQRTLQLGHVQMVQLC